MRRSRRSGHGGMEFGGSGEDSFVAVVVTKLTGALLFILLLTMVIMALLPKSVDQMPARADRSGEKPEPPTITTPTTLPEAIAGRPYAIALAARGGDGPLRWSVTGELPNGLRFDPKSARIEGTPEAGTPEPAALMLHVSDDVARVSQPASLVVYQSDRPLTTPSRWRPGIPPIPLRAWLDQGVGFILLWLVHLVGMNAIASLERRSLEATDPDEESEQPRAAVRLRFAIYRLTTRLATLTATAGLAVWLWRQHS